MVLELRLVSAVVVEALIAFGAVLLIFGWVGLTFHLCREEDAPWYGYVALTAFHAACFTAAIFPLTG